MVIFKYPTEYFSQILSTKFSLLYQPAEQICSWIILTISCIGPSSLPVMAGWFQVTDIVDRQLSQQWLLQTKLINLGIPGSTARHGMEGDSMLYNITAQTSYIRPKKDVGTMLARPRPSDIHYILELHLLSYFLL